MVEDGIFNGDIVIIRRQETCQNGDVVVALLEDGSATLKRLYRENKRIRLQPANSEFEPLYVKRVKIQGRVVGLVRKF
jgi:repressor LexA